MSVTHTNLSKAEQKEAHDHLLRHYKQLGMEHPKCSVPSCQGYAPKKSMLEDTESFRAYQEAYLRAQDESKKELSLREKLEVLREQRQQLETELNNLWKEQQIETKPIDEKYNEKRKEISPKIEKLSSEIEILQHAIGEEIASV